MGLAIATFTLVEKVLVRQIVCFCHYMCIVDKILLRVKSEDKEMLIFQRQSHMAKFEV